ncbi:MAG: DivIVA domain-containing protein [Clostridia bacterium]|nr:DivIVA domain-containing protein [Clostridia bacterium]
MLSSKEIRTIKFSNAVGGYKKEEVDILLDKLEVDLDKYERIFAEQSAKIEALNMEIENYKVSQNSIQNVLLSAQKLADQIVEEAKLKSEQIVKEAEASIELITAKEKELSFAFDRKAGERKAKLEEEIEQYLTLSKEQATKIEKATEDCVERQQAIFERTKLEIANFKADITKRYKEHLEMLSKLPDTADVDPRLAAKAIKGNEDNNFDMNSFSPEQQLEKTEVSSQAVIEAFNDGMEELEQDSAGFTVDDNIKE